MTTQGFSWKGFIIPVAPKDSSEMCVVAKGNFVMEFSLPNALKLTSFTKLQERLERYVESHGGHYPNHIAISKRQYREYAALFPDGTRGGKDFSKVASYQGIPMIIRHG